MSSSASRITLIAVLFPCLLFALLFLSSSSKPDPIDPEKLPLAFWSWRSETPSAADVREAVASTGSKVLFLHAGQLDADGDALKRVRSPKGRIPNGMEIHLVYNVTRDVLRRLESLPPERIAAAVEDSFNEDASRALSDGATVGGIQLDVDYPTRLLPEYGEMLRSLKARLPAGVKLSVTGLTTWTESRHLTEVLDVVDFWVPQLYGAAIPEHITDPQLISSTAEVTRTLSRIRSYGEPYFAGLSAYEYALFFDREGSLIEVRGDLDRSTLEGAGSFVPEGSRAFEGDRGEIRSVYRAVSPVVLAGSVIEEGEFVVIDAPTSSSLRANARAVRQNADENLLGICLFRIPSSSDKTNLRLDEVATALLDREEEFRSRVSAMAKPGGTVELRAINEGTGSVRHGEGELIVDVIVNPAYQVQPTAVSGIDQVHTMCTTEPVSPPVPCSPRRANLVRLAASSWRPGDEASARFSVGQVWGVRLVVMKKGKVVEMVEKSFSNRGEE